MKNRFMSEFAQFIMLLRRVFYLTIFSFLQIFKMVHLTKCQGSGRLQPYYLDFKSMEIYHDIELFSKEREMITLNKCVFACLSSLCHQMLTRVFIEDSTKIVIVTEHTKEHLSKVANFATTGK